MSRWLRREALAIVLTLVLGAGAVAWTLRLDWWPYRDGRPTDLVRAAAGEQARLHGTGFTVTELREVAGDSERGERLGVAEDATLVVVSLEVDPDPGRELGVCTLRLVATGSVETRWDTASYSDTDYGPPDRFETYCAGDATEPYALQSVYVVPSEVVDRLELEVTSSTQLPRALRLELGAATPPAR